MLLIRPLRLGLALLLVALLGACAHPISLDPASTPARNEASLLARKVAYVMNDEQRARQVTTAGGGGDKVSYFPYRDMERAIRESLRAVFSDVVVLRSASDAQALASSGATLVFVPDIRTESSSSSMLTWPPTRFDAVLECKVQDAAGAPVTTVYANASGAAEFDEFKADFSLAARRSVQLLAERFVEALKKDPKLR